MSQASGFTSTSNIFSNEYYRIHQDRYEDVGVVEIIDEEVRRIDDPHVAITIVIPIVNFDDRTVRLYDDGRIEVSTNDTVESFDSLESLRTYLSTLNDAVIEDVQRQVGQSEFGENIEPAIWKKGSLEIAKETPFERLTDSCDVDDELLRQLTRYDTQREKRLENGRPTRGCRRVVKEIPHISDDATKSVLDSYQTVEELSSALISTLQSIDGVGRKTAWKLQRFADLHQRDADKQIPDERTVERVEQMREFALENGLVSRIIEDSNLQSYRGRIYYRDNRIKLRSDLERGGFEAEGGEESFEQVLAHEIAHTLEGSKRSQIDTDDLFDLGDDAVIELRYLKRVDQRDRRRQRDEVFTNFISRIAVEPEKTRELFPNAVREFESNIIPTASGSRQELLERLFNEW